jgi:DNA replication and repair protein RecF
LTYRIGWAHDLTLSEALARSWPQERDLRATQVGPQRAELDILVNGLAAKDRISRGQQKLLAAVLLLSQMRLLPDEDATRPTLLLDDPAAELDGQRLGRLIRAIQAQPLQLIVTTLHEELTDFAEFGVPGRRYRMDSGQLRLA